MVHKADLVIIGVSVGVAVGILLASLAFFCVCWYKRRAHLRRCANERSLATLPIRTNGFGVSIDLSASISAKGPENVAKSSQQSWWSHPSKDRFASASGILRYAYKDIQKATQNFTTVIGKGSFGPVYKAEMPAGGVVAVKVLATDSKQGEREFQTEVTLLGRLHHRNLVNLVGYCVDKGQRMLIYEFMSNGSLANLLYSTERTLSWEGRLQIALDISHGIEYLHDGAAMSPDGVDEILDKKLVGTCNVEEVRNLAAIAHKCLHKTPRKRPPIGDVSHAILKIKQRHTVKKDTSSFAQDDFSRMSSIIEIQE
nr:calcium/calmodulin-regulated receptor-like kinase 2 [Ipomoea batatas]